MKNKELDKIERTIARYLKRGMSIKEVSERMKERGIKPNSIPMVDKTIKKLKDDFNAKNHFQLAYKLTRKKLI